MVLHATLSVLYVMRCLLPPAADWAPVLARECQGSGAGQQLRGTVRRGGAVGVYIASTVVEGVYLIEVF